MSFIISGLGCTDFSNKILHYCFRSKTIFQYDMYLCSFFYTKNKFVVRNIIVDFFHNFIFSLKLGWRKLFRWYHIGFRTRIFGFSTPQIASFERIDLFHWAYSLLSSAVALLVFICMLRQSSYLPPLFLFLYFLKLHRADCCLFIIFVYY